MKRWMEFLIIFFALYGCGHNRVSHTSNNSQEYLLATTLWMQNAAEVRALTYQAYNIARLRLDNDLKYDKSTKKRAIVVDADETIIDNSPYQARNILKNESYNSKSWNKWIEEANADAVPGAVDFLSYASSKGVSVFYITNRKIGGFEGTYHNLKKLGFPVKRANLLLKTTESSKKSRRDQVLKDHRIVLLMGDTLSDFSEVFDEKSTDERNKLTDSFRQEFGRTFIILPNPMYGDWEQALYDYKSDLTPSMRNDMRFKNLRPKN